LAFRYPAKGEGDYLEVRTRSRGWVIVELECTVNKRECTEIPDIDIYSTQENEQTKQ
jgi:hypothetical protein